MEVFWGLSRRRGLWGAEQAEKYLPSFWAADLPVPLLVCFSPLQPLVFDSYGDELVKLMTFL